MTGAPWWVVLASAAIGAAAGIGGSMWATRTARRSAGRAEWFRRLQWAWELTRGDDQSVTAGMVMMDHLINVSDEQDGLIIARIAPIAREVGQLQAAYAIGAAHVDIAEAGSDTGNSDPA